MVQELQVLVGGVEDLHDSRIRHHRRERGRVRTELAVERAAHAVRAGHLHDGEVRTEGGAPDELRVERGHAARDERVAGLLQVGRVADQSLFHYSLHFPQLGAFSHKEHRDHKD